MNTYPTSDAKLALAVNSAQLVKANLVHTHGIGEELPYTILGWRESRLDIVTQATTSLMARTADERFHMLGRAAFSARRGWGATSITFIAEGFCLAPLANTAIDVGVLAERFAAGDPDVLECLTFVHVETAGAHMIATVPYTYTTNPRDVDYPRGLLIQRRTPAEHPFIHLLTRALEGPCTPGLADRLTLALEESGFVTFGEF